MEKPKSVTTAVNLFWASLGVGVLNVAFESAVLRSIVWDGTTLVTLAVTFAIMTFLLVMIGRGKNWARIVLLVLSVLGIPFALIGLSELFARSVVVGALSLATTGLQVYGLYLLFTKPGSDWFAKDKKAAAV